MDYDSLNLPLDQKIGLLQSEIKAVEKRLEILEQVIVDPLCQALPLSAACEPTPVMVHDGQFGLLEANPAFVELCGFSPEAFVLGASILDYFDQESQAQFLQSMDDTSSGGIAVPFETALKCADGSQKSVMAGLTKVGPGDKDWLTYVFDISTRVTLSNKLALKESNLRALTSIIPQLLWVCDAEGHLIYGNENFYNFTGIDKDIDEAIPWTSFLHAADKVSFSGSGFSVGEIYADFQSEVRIHAKNGEYRWHLLKVVPFFNADHATLNWLTIATDIDDQRKVTDALMASEEQLRVIADALPQIVWTADYQGNIDFWNHRWFEYTGLTAQQSLHGGWRLLIHADDLSAYDRAWRDAVVHGSFMEVEFRLKRVLGLGGRRRISAAGISQNRDYLWHLCRAVPVKDSDGQVVRWFGTWTEIEEHKDNLN
ncbi:MAG: PAS domain-containing protein [Candidatus Obscuribacter sp.]|nr:PAS domain-containing protein [Candidatus Obscuribacter sp.]MBP6352038.1 PAS domain-containing protein [Candidatus Obscuribacter sp.]MBP7577019.1 PAS domain-containing protein [Candidatus Obscuribacter sp.]